MGAGDLSSTILIVGVPVEGVEEFIYLGSKQSSNGYCRIRLACSVKNSLQSVLNYSNLSISTKIRVVGVGILPGLNCFCAAQWIKSGLNQIKPGLSGQNWVQHNNVHYVYSTFFAF